MTIELNVATIIYVASCISILGAAVKILAEAKKALIKPVDDINTKLVHYDQCLKNDKTRLDNMDIVLSGLTQSINMLVKSNRTILYHMEEGNHTGEIREEIKEIDAWLLNGKEYKK